MFYFSRVFFLAFLQITILFIFPSPTFAGLKNETTSQPEEDYSICGKSGLTHQIDNFNHYYMVSH